MAVLDEYVMSCQQTVLSIHRPTHCTNLRGIRALEHLAKSLDQYASACIMFGSTVLWLGIPNGLSSQSQRRP